MAGAAAGDVAAGARPDPTCGPQTWEHPSPNPSPASPRRARRGSGRALTMRLMRALMTEGAGDLSSTPCVFFQQGTCKRGDACKFAHVAAADGDGNVDMGEA